MRKFARIKTKLISCILLLAMGALFLASANHVQVDQEYLSFEQYKAEHYINYSSYELFMSDDFKMPYWITVEKDRSAVLLIKYGGFMERYIFQIQIFT